MNNNILVNIASINISGVYEGQHMQERFFLIHSDTARYLIDKYSNKETFTDSEKNNFIFLDGESFCVLYNDNGNCEIEEETEDWSHWNPATEISKSNFGKMWKELMRFQ